MTRLRVFLFRLRALVWSRQVDREIDDEIASHLAEATEEYVRHGLSPETARRAAHRSFGGTTQAKEVYREVQSFMWLEGLARDVRQGLRSLRRSPAFTTASVATLALAIGTNTAMFSVLDAVLLRPLPYRSPDQLATLWTEDPAQNLREGRSALWDVQQWRSRSESFADMATFDSVSTLLSGDEGVEQIVGASISQPASTARCPARPGAQLLDRRSRATAATGPDQSSLLAGTIRRLVQSARRHARAQRHAIADHRRPPR